MMQSKYFTVCLLVLTLLCAESVYAATTADDSFTVRVQYGDDTTPPTVPDPVMVMPIAPTQIDITWGVSIDGETAVAGYQLFRDTVQIATTTLTSYSDIGLTASTTYTYTVTAFDTFGNISAQSTPVATTTLDLPLPPVASTTPSQSSSGGQIRFVVNAFSITPSTNGARFTWSTNLPAIFTLRYGASSAYDDGIIQSNRYATDQVTVISGLVAGTSYFYELYGTDAYGREHLVRRGDFTTSLGPDTTPPPNVSNFTADAFDGDVLLSWQNPSVPDFAYVRIVRNHLFYPVDAADGFIVYEGPLSTFTDAGALVSYPAQFYTIFAYDTAGNFSSGAVARVARARVETVDAVALPQPPNAPADSPDGFATLQFVDIIIEQAGEQVQIRDGTLTIDSTEPFTVKVPYDRFPQNLKVITVTLSHPDNPRRVFSFLLRADEAFTYYSASIGALPDPGVYGLSMTVYDLTKEALVTVAGTLTVEAGVAVEITTRSRGRVTVQMYWFSLLFLLLLLLLVRRWRAQSDRA